MRFIYLSTCLYLLSCNWIARINQFDVFLKSAHIWLVD